MRFSNLIRAAFVIRVSLAGVLLCVQTFGAPFAASAAARFPDVASESPFYEAIMAMADAGIIQGYDDGTFGPDRNLNRAEMATILVRAEGLSTPAPTRDCFPDVARGAWFAKYICAGKGSFWNGYPSGNFEPRWDVNRVEAIEMICNIASWPRETPSEKPFTDAKTNAWYIPCTAYAQEQGYLRNIADGAFLSPEKPMTRAEFSLLYYASRFWSRGGEETEDDDNEAQAEAIVEDGTITTMQQEMLRLTNNERTSRGFSVLEWSGELSVPAALHSQDMAENNYFSHTSRDGSSPDDRRKAQGVSTPVGENLALAPTIASAHEGLMNSPPHKENILRENWERMGIGIVETNDGSLVITQLFAEFPVTENDLSTAETATLETMNAERAQGSLSPLTFDSTLNSIAETWSRRMQDEVFFGVEAPNGDKLTNAVYADSNTKKLQIGIVKGGDPEELTFKALENDVHMGSGFSRAGIKFVIDEFGAIHGTIIITD